jgi:hypothetical protein
MSHKYTLSTKLWHFCIPYKYELLIWYKKTGYYKRWSQVILFSCHGNCVTCKPNIIWKKCKLYAYRNRVTGFVPIGSKPYSMGFGNGLASGGLGENMRQKNSWHGSLNLMRIKSDENFTVSGMRFEWTFTDPWKFIVRYIYWYC